MLIQFLVKNFMSFKDESVLDLSAVKSYKEHEYNLIHYDGGRFLKVAAIYGANASGKSNFFNALCIFQRLVETSANNINNQAKLPIEECYFPYSFSTNFEPTEFEVVCIEKGDEFKYGFQYDSNHIVAEWLYKKNPKTNRYNILIERSSEGIRFGTDIKKECNLFSKQVPDETLVLSFYQKLKLTTDVFKKVYDAVSLTFLAEEGIFENSSILEKWLPYTIDHEYKELMDFVTSIDVGIKDIEYKRDEDGDIIFYTWHIGEDGENYRLNFYNESKGTMKAIALFVVITKTIATGRPLIVDELNAKLHPLLLKHIVDQFHTCEGQSQLIYTTHDTTLMDKKFFRRDQIWFVDKDTFGRSTLCALSDYKIRSDASFEKDYLGGVYGGIPMLKDYQLEA